MEADGEDALERRAGFSFFSECELVHQLQVEGHLVEEWAGQFVKLLHERRFGRRLDHEIELLLFPC